MSLTVLSESTMSNIDLYFPNMSIYFTPGDIIYSVYSQPEMISYKVLKLYEPKHQVINKNMENETYQWEFYGQLQMESNVENVGDYLLYVMNDKMEYSLHFIGEDMGLHSNAAAADEVQDPDYDYYDYGDIEIKKEIYRSQFYY